MFLEFFEILVVCQLHFMCQVNYFGKIFLVVNFVVHSVLDTSVQVYRQHAFRTGRHSSCSKRVAETVVLDLISQSAARA